MHPYRTAPPPHDDDRPGVPLEEWLIGGALVAIGAVRVAIAIATGEAFGAEVTVAAMLGVLGGALIGRAAVR